MENKNTENDYFINPDKIKLFRLIYKPHDSNVKAFVFVCHGLFEHCQSGYYEPIIRPLLDIGCMVLTHDHRGHGLSEGERGMIYDLHSLVRDVFLDIDEVIVQQNFDKNLPVFIYGHSMGGLLSVFASLERKSFFTGMCLEAPALIVPKAVGKGIILVGRIMNKILPSVSISKAKMNDVCRNLECLKEIENDKLSIHRGVPARTAISVLKGLQEIKLLMKNVDTPFLIGHGDADKLCEISGSQILMETCSITDKTLIEFPHAKHRLRAEIDNVDVKFCTAVINWINEKIKK